MSSAAFDRRNDHGVEIGPYFSYSNAGLHTVAFRNHLSPHGVELGVRKNNWGFEIILPSWMNTDNILLVMDRRDPSAKICKGSGEPIDMGELKVLVEADGTAYVYDPHREDRWVKIRRGSDEEPNVSLVVECSNREWLRIYEYKNSFKINRSGVEILEIPGRDLPEEFG